MIINIIGKNNLVITDGMKNSVSDKLSFLDKFLKNETYVYLTISVDKEIHKIEILFFYNNQLVKTKINSNDFYEGMDKLVDVIKNIISKMHSIKVDRNKKKIGLIPELVLDFDAEDKQVGKIVKRKSFSMKPMMEEEAILQMKTLGHSSFMFLNAEANFTTCLLYQRKDGNYGIIESSSLYEEEE